MTTRKVYEEENHVHFVTFSCDRSRRLLDHDKCKQIVLRCLNTELDRKQVECIGFVIMPDHVHALLAFHGACGVSEFMQQWKRLSSYQLKQLFESDLKLYGKYLSGSKRLWTPRFYDFNIYNETKLEEKLSYMHSNPVKAGLVESTDEYPYSSARWYNSGQEVGVMISNTRPPASPR